MARDDEKSPARMLGFVDRRLTERQLLSWRQDWGAPLARGSESVETWKRRRRAG